MSYCARRPLWKNQTEPTDRSAPAVFPRALQPQQRERQTVLYSVRGFNVRNAKDCPIGGTPAQHAASVYPEHDLFVQKVRLENNLRYLVGEELINYLGSDYTNE